jgi:hypothetical protein
MSQEKFEIIEEQTREYRRFNTRDTQWKVRLNPPSISVDPVTHFVASVNEMFDHLLENVDDGDTVGITNHNEVNQSDKPIGFSFRRIRFRQMSYGKCLIKCHSQILDLTPLIR